MSSGKLEVDLPGVYANAEFLNGKIQSGLMRCANITYVGSFDNNGQLHGENCTMILHPYKYQGTFLHGVLSKGCTLLDENIIEQGQYIILNGKPLLNNGVKTATDIKQEGQFDKTGSLINGKISTPNAVFDGIFYRSTLIDGVVTFKIDTRLLVAKYKIKHDTKIKHDVLQQCSVDYCGPIEILNKHLLMLLCCSAVNSECAHRFYLNKLSNYDATAILYLDEKNFTDLTDYEQAGLRIIVSNLNKYKANHAEISTVEQQSANDTNKMQDHSIDYYGKVIQRVIAKTARDPFNLYKRDSMNQLVVFSPMVKRRKHSLCSPRDLLDVCSPLNISERSVVSSMALTPFIPASSSIIRPFKSPRSTRLDLLAIAALEKTKDGGGQSFSNDKLVKTPTEEVEKKINAAFGNILIEKNTRDNFS